MDPRFTIGRVAVSAEEALASVRTPEPKIIVLIHGLSVRKAQDLQYWSSQPRRCPSLALPGFL
jgi:ribosomal protein L30E